MCSEEVRRRCSPKIMLRKRQANPQVNNMQRRDLDKAALELY